MEKVFGSLVAGCLMGTIVLAFQGNELAMTVTLAGICIMVIVGFVVFLSKLI